MSKIGFVGVGNMGCPMACNLMKAGHDVTVFDLSQTQLDLIAEEGATIANSTGEAVKQADVVVTMLPAGKHVKDVYFAEIFKNATQGTLMIDCSTIDVNSSRAVHEVAATSGFPMVDAPVSGGVGGAKRWALAQPTNGFSRRRPSWRSRCRGGSYLRGDPRVLCG